MAKIDITRWSQFTKVYNNIMNESLPKIGEKIAEVLKQYVEDNWYSVEPEIYKRTFEVLNSITVSKIDRPNKDTWSIFIFFDGQKINPNYSTFPVPDGVIRFNHHMSLDGSTKYSGNTIGEWVVYWMNYGQNSTKCSYEGVHFLEDTVKFTKRDKIHIKEIEKVLRASGL